MVQAKTKQFVVMAEVRGVVSVIIDATSKRAALARLREGDWDDKFDVSLEPVGAVSWDEMRGPEW